jgi:hypothetical protein
MFHQSCGGKRRLWLARDSVFQIASLDELQDEVDATSMFEAIKDLNDMRMPQLSENRRFLRQALCQVSRDRLSPGRLQSDEAVQAALTGAIDDRQPPSLKLTKDLVARYA